MRGRFAQKLMDSFTRQVFPNFSAKNEMYFKVLLCNYLQSEDKRLTVYSCDFFKMKPSLLGPAKMDAVFDRGAFEAIFEADRQAYVKLMFQFLQPDFRYILNVYEYQDEIFKGPPRACKKDEVLKLFDGISFEGKVSKATILSEEDFSEYGKSRWNIQDPDMKKIIYAIRAE